MQLWFFFISDILISLLGLRNVNSCFWNVIFLSAGFKVSLRVFKPCEPLSSCIRLRKWEVLIRARGRQQNVSTVWNVNQRWRFKARVEVIMRSGPAQGEKQNELSDWGVVVQCCSPKQHEDKSDEGPSLHPHRTLSLNILTRLKPYGSICCGLMKLEMKLFALRHPSICQALHLCCCQWHKKHEWSGKWFPKCDQILEANITAPVKD